MNHGKLYGQKLRHELIKRECRGKNVLDVGCANLSVGIWLHKEIVKVANHCVGIDINVESVKKLRKEGYDVRLADAEDFHLDEKFEVAVLDELVEHLSNAGKVLDNIRNHLEPQGKMVVTTPNPHSLDVFIMYELRDVGDPTHVAYYTPSVFRRLAKRHGFEERKVIWIQKDLSKAQTFKEKLFAMLERFLVYVYRRFVAVGWLGFTIKMGVKVNVLRL